MSFDCRLTALSYVFATHSGPVFKSACRLVVSIAPELATRNRTNACNRVLRRSGIGEFLDERRGDAERYLFDLNRNAPHVDCELLASSRPNINRTFVRGGIAEAA